MGPAFPSASYRILPKFEGVYEGPILHDLDDFLPVYLERVCKLARRLTSDDTLYLAVSRRGSPRGVFACGR